MNTFGTLFRLTDFGESHGPAIGGVVDGMPAGFKIDFDAVARQLARRRPGQSPLTTQRSEPDEVTFLSGIFDGRTTGTPIGFTIANTNQRSTDYNAIADKYRPGHADYVYDAKYGHRDYRGGGRASARETAVRVVGGALARQVLESEGIAIYAYASRIGRVAFDADPIAVDTSAIDTNPVRCPDADTAARMEKAIREARAARDTLGGIVTCVVTGVPAGLGDPVFGKLSAMLAAAMMGINAAKGFDYGDGFAAAAMPGSKSVDLFQTDTDGRIVTASNHSGGIQGGISNGMPIVFRVAFKPIATMPVALPTVDARGQSTVIEVGGRHDVCVVPRAVPVVEAMAAMTVLDALMQQRARSI